jgi:hypothetical protein
LGRDPRLLCTGTGHRNGKLRGGHPNIDVMGAEGRIEDSLMLFTSTVSCSTDWGRDEHVISEIEFAPPVCHRDVGQWARWYTDGGG